MGAIHVAYLDAGADCIETNTFGANASALAEYDASERITELAEAGARIARRAADAVSTAERPRYVLGSMGPGTKLPSLGHLPYAFLRDAYSRQAEAMIAGGVDGFQIETCQDLLQAKAAVNGARRALTALGADLPIFVNVTIETAGTMLLGTEIGAALTALEPLGIDAIGLNCGTGPTEMSEHLRHLSRNARVPLVCMPNAGLPELTSDCLLYTSTLFCGASPSETGPGGWSCSPEMRTNGAAWHCGRAIPGGSSTHGRAFFRATNSRQHWRPTTPRRCV